MGAVTNQRPREHEDGWRQRQEDLRQFEASLVYLHSVLRSASAKIKDKNKNMTDKKAEPSSTSGGNAALVTATQTLQATCGKPFRDCGCKPGDRKQDMEESPVLTHSLQLILGAPRAPLSGKGRGMVWSIIWP